MQRSQRAAAFGRSVCLVDIATLQTRPAVTGFRMIRRTFLLSLICLMTAQTCEALDAPNVVPINDHLITCHCHERVAAMAA